MADDDADGQQGDEPPGVDPALWAEFRRLSDVVHKLHKQRAFPDEDEGEEKPPTRRMVIDIPEEWFLLFAWIDYREQRRRKGHNTATGLTPEFIATLNQTGMRRLVAGHIQFVLDNDFHAMLHGLATGRSHLLRPEPPRPPPQPLSGDLDDGLPF